MAIIASSVSRLPVTIWTNRPVGDGGGPTQPAVRSGGGARCDALRGRTGLPYASSSLQPTVALCCAGVPTGPGRGPVRRQQRRGLCPRRHRVRGRYQDHRIQRSGANGEYIDGWARTWQFDSPSQVAVAPDGTSTWRTTKTIVFSASPARVCSYSKWGTQGQADGQLSSRAASASGQMAAPMSPTRGNHRVQRFANGQFLGKWGSHGHAVEQLLSPWGST